MTKASIIVPCYNRRNKTEVCLDSLAWSVEGSLTEVELICVEDGSSDDTREFLKGRPEIDILVCHDYNEGLSRSIADGQFWATGDIMVKVDGDMQFLKQGWLDVMVKVLESDDKIAFCSVYSKIRGPNPPPIQNIAGFDCRVCKRVPGCILGMTRKTHRKLGYPWIAPTPYGLLDDEYCDRATMFAKMKCVMVCIGDVANHPSSERGEMIYRRRKMRYKTENHKPLATLYRKRKKKRRFYVRHHHYDDAVRDWVRCGFTGKMFVGYNCWASIRRRISSESVTLEAGCGLSTALFSDITVHHIALENDGEHAKRVSHRMPYPSPVRHESLTGNPPWYAHVPEGWFDLILVDGPFGGIGRSGFLRYLKSLCLEHTSLVFDDTHREAEFEMAVRASRMTGNPMTTYGDGPKKFSIVEPIDHIVGRP